jgi:hypothetical protein
MVPIKIAHKHTMRKDAIIEGGTNESDRRTAKTMCVMLQTPTLLPKQNPLRSWGEFSTGKNGASSMAEGIVERATTSTLRYFDDSTAKRKPKLDFLPCFQCIIPVEDAKEYGDILSAKCGRNVVVDIAFSFKTNVTLSA